MEVVVVSTGTSLRAQVASASLIALLSVGLAKVHRWEKLLALGAAVALYVEFLESF